MNKAAGSLYDIQHLALHAQHRLTLNSLSVVAKKNNNMKCYTMRNNEKCFSNSGFLAYIVIYKHWIMARMQVQ